MTAQTAYRESLRAELPTMASQLQDVFGQRLVAFVTGQKSNKTVGRWARGETDAPGDEAMLRLRTLFRVMLTLRAYNESDATVRAWLSSPNPDLGEDVPAQLLRTGETHRVIAALQLFVGEAPEAGDRLDAGPVPVNG